MEWVCGQVVTVVGMGLSQFEWLLVGTVWSLAWESGTVVVMGIGKVGSVAGSEIWQESGLVGQGWWENPPSEVSQELGAAVWS